MSWRWNLGAGKHATAKVQVGEVRTKIFALGIAASPAHIMMHLRSHAEEIGIAFLDSQGGGDGEQSGERE